MFKKEDLPEPFRSMTPEQEKQFLQEIDVALRKTDHLFVPQEIEYRVYYNERGEVITYTTEKLPGEYLVITVDEFNRCRHDALIRDGRLIFTNGISTVMKLERGDIGTFKVHRGDISVPLYYYELDNTAHDTYRVNVYEAEHE
jgi:hypothetical protein